MKYHVVIVMLDDFRMYAYIVGAGYYSNITVKGIEQIFNLFFNKVVHSISLRTDTEALEGLLHESYVYDWPRP